MCRTVPFACIYFLVAKRWALSKGAGMHAQTKNLATLHRNRSHQVVLSL